VAIVVAMLVGWAATGWLQSMPDPMLWITLATLIVAVVSFIDDLRDLSARLRFVVHGLAAAVLVAVGLVVFGGWFGVLFSWLAIVWMINLYNFMDGMDGFAGGMTVFGFASLALAGWMQGAIDYAFYAGIVVAAAIGFLPVNFPPARMFTGDVGSATLGLVAAGFSLWGVKAGVFSSWFPVLVFSPFVVDASVTIIRRILNREKIWQAHRSHYYQRLVQFGWGHRKTVLAEYLLMLLVSVSALLMLHLENHLVEIAGIAAWCLIYLAVAFCVHRLEQKCV